MKVKKNPKLILDQWSSVFFMVGLAIMLSASYLLLEWKFYDTAEVQEDNFAVQDDLLLDIPVVELQNQPPPPPPAPTIQTIIEVIEDDSTIEEVIIESTETNQDTEIVDVEEIIEVEEEEEIIEVPFSVIEDVPIYPGCEGLPDKNSQKECMKREVMVFVQENFNTELASELGLEGKQRISVIFKIDVTGATSNIRARAPHPKLETEAIRVVKKLPKMTPGKQRGRPVEVLYSLPILFQVEIKK